jgi:uncharacterized protein YndB with AHSA1/START domain
VWEALTQPEIIKQYFFGTNTEASWKPGTPVRFYGEYEGKKYEDKGMVLENVEGERLTYSYWSSMSGFEDKPENYANITYNLQEENNGTELTIMQDNIPDEKMKAHSAENWNLVLSNLKKVVENKDHS